MTRARLSMLAFAALALSLAACDGDSSYTDVAFHPTWTLNGTTDPNACADLGADKAEFLFTQASNSMGFDELFDCGDFAGETAPLPIDDYTYVGAMLSCPDSTPGCPGSTTLAMSQQLSATDDCDDISDFICHVDLPTFDFVLN